eukprot:1158210-Pelagomonas_calceolata.AAC.4
MSPLELLNVCDQYQQFPVPRGCKLECSKGILISSSFNWRNHCRSFAQSCAAGLLNGEQQRAESSKSAKRSSVEAETPEAKRQFAGCQARNRALHVCQGVFSTPTLCLVVWQEWRCRLQLFHGIVKRTELQFDGPTVGRKKERTVLRQ